MTESQTIPRPDTRSRIEYLTEVRPIAFPDEWYEANSEEHFWFEWRARTADALIRRVGLPTDQRLEVLDIGCGTGITCRQLRRTTSWTFDGADLNEGALSRCDVGGGRILYYDILERRADFHQRYDIVILFDVIEHIEPTAPFLDAVLYHLKPGGIVLVNVPALMTLFGVYDTVAGHYRRYTPATMAKEFAGFNATVLDQVYWGFSTVPLVWLRKYVLRPQTSQARAIQTGFTPPSKLVHSILWRTMAIETALIRRPPLGTSVMSAIRKNA